MIVQSTRKQCMLADFLLELSCDPNRLASLDLTSRSLERWQLSEDALAAINNGDTSTLRMLLQAELSAEHKKSIEDAATLSTESAEASHESMKRRVGIFDSSFWGTLEPDPTWDFTGLTVVGTGIRAGLQTTPEAVAHIRNAEDVLYLVSDAFAGAWLRSINPRAESLEGFYRRGQRRIDIYHAIIDAIVARVRSRASVCVVYYGHPGTFVYAAHEAIRLARKEGFKARMLPGVSADANLSADLCVDPGVAGLQSYEATSFLLNQYRFDTSAGLLLWQVAFLGYLYWDPDYEADPQRLQVLVEYLTPYYGGEHEIVLYEASEFPLGNPFVRKLRLQDLASAEMLPITTLYVPPKQLPNADLGFAKKLGFKYPIRKSIMPD